MNCLVKTVFVLMCFSFGVSAQKSLNVLEKTKVEQRQLVALLTGHDAVEMDITPKGSRVLKNKIEVARLSDRHTLWHRKISSGILSRALKDIGLNPKRHEYNSKATGTNIYAVISATAKSDEFIILGAHYDSVSGSPGANDNASGVALVYGVALNLIKAKIRKRNVIVVFFDQEERGLIGSRAFAKKLKDERMKVHSVHTADQMGWDKDGDRAIELELPTPKLEALYRREAKKLGIPIHKTNVPSTDHTAFREIGFNAIGVTEEYKNKDTTPHYHKASDTFGTINFDYLASSTFLVLNVMKSLTLE